MVPGMGFQKQFVVNNKLGALRHRGYQATFFSDGDGVFQGGTAGPVATMLRKHDCATYRARRGDAAEAGP